MKNISRTYQILALSLAFLMFTTSLSFNLDAHFCQGHLKSFNLFGKAKNCYELAGEASMQNCVHHQQKVEQKPGCSIDKKDCCERKTFHLQSHQNQEIQTFDFVINNHLQQFIVAYVLVFFTDNLIEKSVSSFEHYLPPLISRDIYVLSESVLL